MCLLNQRYECTLVTNVFVSPSALDYFVDADLSSLEYPMKFAFNGFIFVQILIMCYKSIKTQLSDSARHLPLLVQHMFSRKTLHVNKLLQILFLNGANIYQ